MSQKITLWDQLRETANKMAFDGSARLDQVQTMRAAAVQMENWFEANVELREENDELRAKLLTQQECLTSLSEVFHLCGKFARSEIHSDPFATAMRDTAAFKNIMAEYGLGEKKPVRKRTKSTPQEPTP